MATERPDGIEMVDALPEDALTGEPPAEDSTADLSRGQGNRPSMDDALVTSAGSSFSPIQAVLKASEEPLEYLVRSNLEDDEINALILDNSLRHYAIQGRINPSLDSFLFVTMRGSRGGERLNMARDMYMGRQQASREMRQEGVLQRMQTIDQHTVEQNGTQR
jgi:hypothetical protein